LSLPTQLLQQERQVAREKLEEATALLQEERKQRAAAERTLRAVEPHAYPLKDVHVPPIGWCKDCSIPRTYSQGAHISACHFFMFVECKTDIHMNGKPTP
jgi:hypothetical protein